MGFKKKFEFIALIILSLPFFIILLFVFSGTSNCLETVKENLPAAIQRDMETMNKATKEYCNPDTGKFLIAKKFADLTLKIYRYYIWIGIIVSFIIARIWNYVDPN